MSFLQVKVFHRLSRFVYIPIIVVSIVFSSCRFVRASENNTSKSAEPIKKTEGISQVYLPIIQKSSLPTLHIPYFNDTQINYHQAAVTWFGQVRGNENYADIRAGYTSDKIVVRVSIFDRFLWYDENPAINNLEKWDAVTLYLDINGNSGSDLGSSMYRFTRQLQWWDDGLIRQVAYQGDISGWKQLPLAFFADYGWEGNAPNDGMEDRGFIITFHIPFSSLGITSKPPDGKKWGAAITLHDRDDANGVYLSEKDWPQEFNPSRSETWGQFSFGIPTFTPPPATNPQVYTIRNGLNGVNVVDGVVGGNSTCGAGLDFWWVWGDHTYPTQAQMNVQNQGNIADWPCYSKFYITFPLDGLPFGQEVISATLTLYQSGQATGFSTDPPEAKYSLIQLLAINQNWDKNTLSWNNAPIPMQNVSQSWVGDITMAELGKPSVWDLSSAVTEAYNTRVPLRLVAYSADSYGPHGKYFYSSEQDWQIMRPKLMVTLSDP